jgi:hypothetical protein
MIEVRSADDWGRMNWGWLDGLIVSTPDRTRAPRVAG